MIYNFTLFVITGISFCVLYETALNDKKMRKAMSANIMEAVFFVMLFLGNAYFIDDMYTELSSKLILSLCTGILLFNAYCDYKIGKLKTIYGYIFVISATVFFTFQILNMGHTTNDLIILEGIVLMEIILMFFLTRKNKKWHMLETKTGFAFVGCGMLLIGSVGDSQLFPLNYIAIHAIISILLMMIPFLKNFSFKTMELKNRYPFTPCIYLGYYVTTYICQFL